MVWTQFSTWKFQVKTQNYTQNEQQNYILQVYTDSDHKVVCHWPKLTLLVFSGIITIHYYYLRFCEDMMILYQITKRYITRTIDIISNVDIIFWFILTIFLILYIFDFLKINRPRRSYMQILRRWMILSKSYIITKRRLRRWKLWSVEWQIQDV